MGYLYLSLLLKAAAGVCFCHNVPVKVIGQWNISQALIMNPSDDVGMYLIVITKKRNVGSLLGHAVWKMVEFEIIAYKKTLLHLTEAQVSILMRPVQAQCLVYF